MTYRVSDEQIANLAHAEAEVYRTVAVDTDGTRAFMEHPAFQAIINAAQAQALRDYAEALSKNSDAAYWDGVDRLWDIQDWADAVERGEH